jgi:hypothetical protein
MKAVLGLNFKTQIVRERSITPVVEKLGEHVCSMELFTDDGKIEPHGSGTIEWVIGEDEEIVHIGVWWEKRRLTDYDGVFSLNPYAIKLLRNAGITVGKDFTD